MQGHDNKTKLPIMPIELSILKYKLRVILWTVTPRSLGTFPVNCIPLISPSATTLPVPEVSWPFLALKLGFNQCISGLPVPKALGHGENRPEPFLQNVFYRKNSEPIRICCLWHSPAQLPEHLRLKAKAKRVVDAWFCKQYFRSPSWILWAG